MDPQHTWRLRCFRLAALRYFEDRLSARELARGVTCGAELRRMLPLHRNNYPDIDRTLLIISLGSGVAHTRSHCSDIRG
jgi:hypothetical protein